MAKKSNNTSTVTFYPSFQALAEATAVANKDNTLKEIADDKIHTPEIDNLGLRSAADYPRQSIEWLWPQKIPLGRVTLLIGDPGLGKSLIALDVASRVTTGSEFPNPTLPNAANPQSEIPNPQSTPPGSVLVLSAEDEIADTIRPRLDAHGADLAKIFFASELTDLRRDGEKLAAILDRIPDCRLIIVDPVNAFVGPSDSHFHTVVRKVLAPLSELAAKRKIAIFAVTHLRKNTGRVIQSAAGSMGFVAAARTVWTVCRDPADATRNLLLPVKNNVGPLSPGLAYSIATDAAFDAPIIHWQPEPIANTAEDIVKSATKSRGPEAEDRRNAGDWLKLMLADGPQESWLILREGKENGFSVRTLQRAIHGIGGQTRKRGFGGGWDWCLPIRDNAAPPPNQSERRAKSTAEPPIEKPPAEKPGVFDETWRLREKSDEIAAQILSDEVPFRSPYLDIPTDKYVSTDQYVESLICRDAQPDPPDFTSDEDPLPPTGHARLDQLVANYRKAYYSYPPELLDPSPTTPPPTSASPLPSTAQKYVPARKKSARSHSRFNTGTDSWHSRPADPCESGATHLGDVSAHVQDESNTRRRGDAI